MIAGRGVPHPCGTPRGTTVVPVCALHPRKGNTRVIFGKHGDGKAADSKAGGGKGGGKHEKGGK